MKKYINIRIAQLKEELSKMKDFQYPMDMISDKEWYNRLIQELEWVVLLEEKKGNEEIF
jgi:hypothetical protein